MYADTVNDDISTKPLLSICIPTYNRSAALDTCLFSICSQLTWDALKIEIIISDNASTDNTKSIVTKWQSKFSNIRYYCNDENIGGIKNFWKVSEYVITEFFWFIGDDFIIMPYAIRHVIDELLLNSNANLFIVAGTNNYADQPPLIRNKIISQGNVLVANGKTSKNELICSLCLQTLGNISFIVARTELWKKTNYSQQASYFIYSQIRSVLEIASMDGDILFSNQICVTGYRAGHDHNNWYFDKAPLSIVIEFPWLQNYAKKLGFNMIIENGLHKSYFSSSLKQWIKMLLSHPAYCSLYGQSIALQIGVVKKLIFIVAQYIVIPIAMPLRFLLEKRGAKFLNEININLSKSA